jgi:hypothetical protein
MKEERKPRIRVMGNTVYEINRRTGKIEGIFHGKERYFASHQDEAEEFEDQFEEEPQRPTESNKHKHIKAFAKGMIGSGRKLAIISEADGLDKEIAIVDVEEPKKTKERLFRKKKSAKPKSKRKTVKKCRCKK